MIQLLNIEKSYTVGSTTQNVLSGLNFSISPRDLIVIRGPSGSGKSTLLNLIGLLDHPTAGTISVDGKNVSFQDFDKLARLRSHTVSFVFQSFNLNPVLTAEENVMVPLMIRHDIPHATKVSRVREWIEKVGLSEHRHKRPDMLSGGQRQRVAIARAMVSEPRLVIADEPTANLDSVTTKSILNLMRNLSDEKGTAFVFATHDPVLDEFAKTNYRMKDGKLMLEPKQASEDK